MNTVSLSKTAWQQKSYYQIARKGSLDMSHPGMEALKKLSRRAKNILDLGCGEGSRLNLLVSQEKQGLGIDISSTAITLAKNAFPKLKFERADLENLPLQNESFDLVYSAFVLEHLNNPQKVLKEAMRVLSFKGHLVLIAPNFGAPNRSSPPFEGSRVKKLLSGFLADILRLMIKQNRLNWHQVKPLANCEKYDIDWDTTVEPYLGTILPYLKSKGLKIIKADSCWSQQLPYMNFGQVVFKILGQLNLYPFSMWGPHLLVVAQKEFKQ